MKSDQQNNYKLIIILFVTSINVLNSRGEAFIAESADSDFQQISEVQLRTGNGLNAHVIQDSPILLSADCKFGRAIPAKCHCPNSYDEPICGSDLESYANPCEFKCAQKCNPRLIRFDGECPKDGGPPKRDRLDFTKVDNEEEEDSPGQKEVSDYDEDVKSAGHLSRGLGGEDFGFPIDGFGEPVREEKPAGHSALDLGYPLDDFSPPLG